MEKERNERSNTIIGLLSFIFTILHLLLLLFSSVEISHVAKLINLPEPQVGLIDFQYYIQWV